MKLWCPRCKRHHEIRGGIDCICGMRGFCCACRLLFPGFWEPKR